MRQVEFSETTVDKAQKTTVPNSIAVEPSGPNRHTYRDES